MHGRSQHVAFQAQHQLANLGIRFRPDVAQLLFIRLGRPRIQAPVFIVEEDATELDRRRSGHVIGLDHHLVHPLHRHVCPPIERRNAHLLAQCECPVGHAPAVATRDDQCLVHARERFLHLFQHETFRAAFQRRNVYLAVFCQLAYPLVTTRRAQQDDHAAFRHVRLHLCIFTCHTPDIPREQFRHLLHSLSIRLVINDRSFRQRETSAFGRHGNFILLGLRVAACP